MSDKATTGTGSTEGAAPADVKGKGKAVEQTQDMSMDEDTGESSDEGGEDVSF